ncbi:hypothetical protein PMZ80_004028 [Knufia obscura]|uniref:Uncharacterized protein n=2 Tax=Knufia TaxID=430999 RepID=A0AAN8ELL8_9EURO|nr:hypothetical protein PMZ80_004028 [Knufia obscura]KAK5952245.1 hypothetical protein OHC33_006718 [Knufia fluminis]
MSMGGHMAIDELLATYGRLPSDGNSIIAPSTSSEDEYDEDEEDEEDDEDNGVDETDWMNWIVEDDMS